jgi:hypothetical protein
MFINKDYQWWLLHFNQLLNKINVQLIIMGNFFFQRAVTMIPAHDNPLAAIAFNAQGNRIATASEKV